MTSSVSESPGEITTVSRLFSLRSVASTGLEVSYQKIGFGQCGLVFTKPGSAHVVKIARPYFSDALWDDFLSHLRLSRLCPSTATPMNLSVSRAFTYTSIRITPHEPLRESAKASPLNNDCLARVYLGRRRQNPHAAPPTPNFSLRNFNFCLDQMLELGLPVREYAREIASCLAILHWHARMDGYDIEFVLGSDAEPSYITTHVTESLGIDVEDLEELPKHTDSEVSLRLGLQRRAVRLWVVDFNLCNRFPMKNAFILEHEKEFISQLVLAFFENDPYYPLPLMELDVDRELWSIFRQEYEKMAAEILSESETLKPLPRKFLDACVEREQRKLEEGLGHGHRDFQG
ncbi:zinc finger protein-domain-containing protein [Podospora australis]|uniref:Zinc finger protein-domain-containing protein n=1 Tax=Podospora australis TaxID=1536484 RepID=A0AAN7AEI1_9PEZI|nr:zinc finger protein-domain-containing protein [Podospora australis]